MADEKPIVAENELQARVMEFVRAMPKGGMAIAVDTDVDGKTRMVSYVSLHSASDMAIVVQYFLLMMQQAAIRGKTPLQAEVLGRLIRYWTNNVPETLH